MHRIFDPQKLYQNRLWAKDHMEGHDFLFERAAHHLLDKLDDIQKDYHDILVIGERGFGFLKDKISNKNIELFDFDNGLNEIPSFGEGQFDCILSLPYLHGVNDVKGFLSAVKYMLRPDGFFLCSFFGGQSLSELRACITEAEMSVEGGVSQHIHPMIDHYQFAGLLQDAGFALPVVDFDRLVVDYSRLDNVYLDLKNMGEGNALLNRNKNINKIKKDIEIIYKNKFYNNGFSVTYDTIYGIGWKPHESQQKPADRGSGQVSLTEIL